MQAGQLRHQIVIAVRDTAPIGANGEPPITFTPYLKTWAAVEDPYGQQFFRGYKFAANITHIVRLRYHRGYVAGMIVLWDNRRFDVMVVTIVDERRKEMLLQCVEYQTTLAP